MGTDSVWVTRYDSSVLAVAARRCHDADPPGRRVRGGGDAAGAGLAAGDGRDLVRGPGQPRPGVLTGGGRGGDRDGELRAVARQADGDALRHLLVARADQKPGRRVERAATLQPVGGPDRGQHVRLRAAGQAELAAGHDDRVRPGPDLCGCRRRRHGRLRPGRAARDGGSDLLEQLRLGHRLRHGRNRGR